MRMSTKKKIIVTGMLLFLGGCGMADHETYPDKDENRILGTEMSTQMVEPVSSETDNTQDILDNKIKDTSLESLQEYVGTLNKSYEVFISGEQYLFDYDMDGQEEFWIQENCITEEFPNNIYRLCMISKELEVTQKEDIIIGYEMNAGYLCNGFLVKYECVDGTANTQEYVYLYEEKWGKYILKEDSDFNGNGLSDKLMVEESNDGGEIRATNNLKIVLDNGTIMEKEFTEPAVAYAYTADFNGDGIEDILLFLRDRTSNMGASNVHILAVERSKLVEFFTFITGAETSVIADEYKQSLYILGQSDYGTKSEPDYTYNTSCSNAYPVAVELENGEKVTGIFLDHTIKDVSPYTILIMQDGKWTVYEQGIQ